MVNVINHAAFRKRVCSPWCFVSHRESFWREVANPSTRSGKRNMSHCVIMASSLTTPVYMWVSTPPLLSFPFSFFFLWASKFCHFAVLVRDVTGNVLSWLNLLNTLCDLLNTAFHNENVSLPSDVKHSVKKQSVLMVITDLTVVSVHVAS